MAAIDSALENVEATVAEVGSYLITNKTSSLSDEDLISNVSGGAALCGLVVGLMDSTYSGEVIKLAANPLVMKPDKCQIKF